MKQLEGEKLDREHKKGLQSENPLADLPNNEMTFSEKLEYARELRQDYD